MRKHNEHHHRHCHGDEGHWGKGTGRLHHRHGGEARGWGPGAPFRRHFPTREEQIAWLEEYLKELQAEAKGVEERIAELRAGQ